MARTVLAASLLGDGRRLEIVDALADDASTIAEVIVDAFGHRPRVDPPPPALAETAASVASALDAGFGVMALLDGRPAGVILVSVAGQRAGIHRVSVRPRDQRLGIASAMVEVVLEVLALREVREVELIARAEFPEVLAWWRRHGFVEAGRQGPTVALARPLPICVVAPTAADTHRVGQRLAGLLKAGDALIASGELGAGKTTLAQGLGEGLNVTGPVISPTFVLSRIHPSASDGPALVHVDAYRLGSAAELEDLALEDDLAQAVILIEWGAGMAEALFADRLEIDIRRSIDPEDERRWIFLTPIGARWADFSTQWEDA